LKGAFVDYISYFEQPIAYFGPGYQDVLTVVHEMGHYVAFHHFDQSILPYDLAETHSQGSEWTFMAYMQSQEITPAVYEAFYLERALSGLITVLYSTIVDHFEELVYTAETPIKADGYKALMDSVCAQYKGVEESLAKTVQHTPFEYAQHVTIASPVYYLNYAPSELASMGFYVIAQQKGYASAQAAFTLLQEGVDPESDFLTAIKEAGLPSPLEKKTYTDLRTALLGE
jgi:oligoendopeptidase F